MKNSKKEIIPKQEIHSLNENIYDFFSVNELEQRLQMSGVASWTCGTDCGCGQNGPNCNPNCNPGGDL